MTGGINMLSKFINFSLVVMLLNCHHSYAEHVKPVQDILHTGSFDTTGQSREAIDNKMQSCESDDTAVVTIYSTTGKAQVGIDVRLDGSPVGSLTTHFPDTGPACKSAGTNGIITIVLPAGKHTLEAESLNLRWSTHTFDVKKCECKLLPLS
jgi:hypothetical protein